MMGLRRVVLACVIAMPLVAVAQPKGDKGQAQDLVKKAIAKSQAGDHLGAIDLYLDAYRLAPLAQLLSNIGTEYKQANKPVEALKYFCKYLDIEPTGQLATYATSEAKVLQVQLGNKDVEVCKPPRPDKVETPDEPTGAGTVTDKPAAKPTDKPAEPKVIDETHEGTVSSGGGNTLKYVGLGGIAVGAVVLGVGGYYGYRAKHFSDEITNHDPMDAWPDSIKQDEADGKSAQTKQIAFMVAGGAIAATGIVIYLVARSKSPEEQHATARIVPTATPDSIGLTLTGGF
ncbi:MAG TPA: tetratricopeptide repeat protein [Kofleriaceae bacterium]|nr:tetratricopeptide repeat protein [Kofleriaceae bacterium]